MANRTKGIRTGESVPPALFGQFLADIRPEEPHSAAQSKYGDAMKVEYNGGEERRSDIDNAAQMNTHLSSEKLQVNHLSGASS